MSISKIKIYMKWMYKNQSWEIKYSYSKCVWNYRIENLHMRSLTYITYLEVWAMGSSSWVVLLTPASSSEVVLFNSLSESEEKITGGRVPFSCLSCLSILEFALVLSLQMWVIGCNRSFKYPHWIQRGLSDIASVGVSSMLMTDDGFTLILCRQVQFTVWQVQFYASLVPPIHLSTGWNPILNISSKNKLSVNNVHFKESDVATGLRASSRSEIP